MRFREYAGKCRDEKRKRGEKLCPSCDKDKCKGWWTATGRGAYMGEALSERFFTALPPSTAKKVMSRIAGKELPGDYLRRLVFEDLDGSSHNQQLDMAIGKALEYLEHKHSDLDINDADRAAAIARLKAARNVLGGAKPCQ